jgi:RNA polymerase sigma-70 factor, ECF subfamily
LTLDGQPPPGPTEWFPQLADRELDRAYRLAGLILGSFDDAEDATHDAFVRAWNRAGSLRDPGRFQAWFDRILVNVCRDRLRRARIVRFVPVAGEIERSDSDPYERLIRTHDILSALEVLDVDQRVAVVLRYWADLTVDDIAQRLGWPSGTVKSRLHRAIAAMRDKLADRTEWETTR